MTPAKRIAQHSVEWTKLAALVPPHQKAQFLAFKARSDGYLRRVLANPEKAPVINWADYKAKIPVAGMVDEFQKQYQALTIPYPSDTVSSQIDAAEKEIKSDIDKFKSESGVRIADYEKQLAHLASLIPYDQMTLEDFRDAFPEEALDPINKPTFWPHNVTERLDYDHEKQRAQEDH